MLKEKEKRKEDSKESQQYLVLGEESRELVNIRRTRTRERSQQESLTAREWTGGRNLQALPLSAPLSQRQEIDVNGSCNLETRARGRRLSFFCLTPAIRRVLIKSMLREGVLACVRGLREKREGKGRKPFPSKLRWKSSGLNAGNSRLSLSAVFYLYTLSFLRGPSLRVCAFCEVYY